MICEPNRQASIERLRILQLADNIPTPKVRVVVSLSARIFRIKSEVPLAYSVKASFGLLSMDLH